MSNIERKLATIREIQDIFPIDGADAIEVARVDGWNVVVKKGEFRVGEIACYLEIDSWVPTEIAPFLSKGKEPNEYNGVKGERLRSVKLRGQISQGLLIKLEHHIGESVLPFDHVRHVVTLGEDVTQKLGIQKWEAPVPAQLAGQIEGLFPTHLVSKTDQERIQNCYKDVQNRVRMMQTDLFSNVEFVIEEKLDGSSCTIICHNGEFKVCSRNLELRRDENNSFWKAAMKYEKTLMDFHTKHNRNFAIQGELIGLGIQGNPYKLQGQELYVFDMYDIDVGFYLVRDVREKFVEQFGMKNVPVVGHSSDTAGNFEASDVERILKVADGQSFVNPETIREGVVYKCTKDGRLTFKAISNRWLIKKGE